MFTQSFVHHRPLSAAHRSLMLALGVTLFALLPLGVARADGPGPQPLPEERRIVYKNSEATATQCATEGERTICTDTIINVLEQNDAAQVCASRYRYELGPTDERKQVSPTESGCGSLPKHAFTLDTQLKRATLSPSNVTAKTQQCAESGECVVLSSRQITVAAEMNGVGSIEEHRTGWEGVNNGCLVSYEDRYRTRSANGMVPFDAERSAATGRLAAGESRTTVRCK